MAQAAPHSMVIPARDAAEVLPTVLDALAREQPPAEVIVVDDGSGDENRVPVHYFALVRLPFIYRRIAGDRRLRGRFLANFPRLVVAEWTLGASAMRWAARRPALRGGQQPIFE